MLFRPFRPSRLSGAQIGLAVQESWRHIQATRAPIFGQYTRHWPSSLTYTPSGCVCRNRQGTHVPLNQNMLPPHYLLELIPGAKALADDYHAHRADVRNHALAREKAAAAAVPLTHRGAIAADDARPGDGVSRAQWEKAIDAYRNALHATSTAERRAATALRQIHKHVEEGMAAPDFVTHHEGLIQTADSEARSALAALRGAVQARDDLLRVVGRRVRLRSWQGLNGALHDITEYVNAPTAPEGNFRALASRLLEDVIMLPDARLAFAKAVLRIDELPLSDSDKLATLRRETGR